MAINYGNDYSRIDPMRIIRMRITRDGRRGQLLRGMACVGGQSAVSIHRALTLLIYARLDAAC